MLLTLGTAWSTLLVRCRTWRCLETPSFIGAGPEAAGSPFSCRTFEFLVAAGAEEACDETFDPLLDQGLVEVSGCLGLLTFSSKS